MIIEAIVLGLIGGAAAAAATKKAPAAGPQAPAPAAPAKNQNTATGQNLKITLLTTGAQPAATQPVQAAVVAPPPPAVTVATTQTPAAPPKAAAAPAPKAPPPAVQASLPAAPTFVPYVPPPPDPVAFQKAAQAAVDAAAATARAQTGGYDTPEARLKIAQAKLTAAKMKETAACMPGAAPVYCPPARAIVAAAQAEVDAAQAAIAAAAKAKAAADAAAAQAYRDLVAREEAAKIARLQQGATPLAQTGIRAQVEARFAQALKGGYGDWANTVGALYSARQKSFDLAKTLIAQQYGSPAGVPGGREWIAALEKDAADLAREYQVGTANPRMPIPARMRATLAPPPTGLAGLNLSPARRGADLRRRLLFGGTP